MPRLFRLNAIALLALAGTVSGMALGQDISGVEAAAAIERTLVDVIARCEKSVVAIARVRKDQPGETFSLEARPDPFGRRPVAPADPDPTDPDFIPNEYGTGVVIDRAGLILTAYHVLGENSEYYVRTPDRKVYRARIKGADPRSDLAVLSVEAVDLTPIVFEDAAGVKKGQIVIALGNPYAIARDGQVSAAWGIVANLNRKAPPQPSATGSSEKPTLHHFGTLIQTDAKLNLGTSGGALVNLKGRMVGLIVSLAAVSGYEQAGGYAIPVDETFRRVVRTLKEGREVEYGFLGIQPTNLLQQEVLAGLQGARVDWIVPGTPAAAVDLRPDDLVTAIDGRPIYEADALVLEVGRKPVETVARLELLRDGRRRTVDVTLAKYPVRGRMIVTTRPEPWRGLRVDYRTAVVDPDSEGEGASFPDRGVIIAEVEEGTSAWDVGLRRGMRITHVDGKAVDTPAEFQAAVADKSDAVELRLPDEQEETLRTVSPL